MNSENPKQQPSEKEFLRLIQNLKTTFRFSGNEDALLASWRAGLAGLTDAQVQKGEQRLYQERTNGFLPTPGEFRAYAQAETYRHSGGTYGLDWWIAQDKDGLIVAWHTALKDRDGNLVARDPALIWTRTAKDQRGVPVNQILDGCGMENCTGRGRMDMRQERKPGHRLRVKCDKCGVATEWFGAARQAITRWNGE